MKDIAFIKNFVRNHKKLLIFLLLIFLFTSITNKYGPYSGKVVDAETGAPIAGAVVFMTFYTAGPPHPGGSTSHYAGAAEAVTDDNGEFKLSYRAFVFHPLCFWDTPWQQVFKPGYGVWPDHIKSRIMPEKRKGSGIPERQYVTIKLPKLQTREEQRRSLLRVSLRGPYSNRISLTKSVNQGRIYLGIPPIEGTIW